jgi:hypothetical protein
MSPFFQPIQRYKRNLSKERFLFSTATKGIKNNAGNRVVFFYKPKPTASQGIKKDQPKVGPFFVIGRTVPLKKVTLKEEFVLKEEKTRCS